MPTVFLISANPFPERPLQIDVEMRGISQRLPRTWDIKPAPAARIEDLVTGMRKYRPDIVHFSSHGSPTERVILLDEENKAQEISRATIKNLFSVMADKVRLVVFNACYSKAQAELVAESVDCVIGVSGTLPDTSAIKYSEQFYEALAAKRSVLKAHEEAGIILTDIASDHKPELIARKKGVDPGKVIISGAQRRPKPQPALHPAPALEPRPKASDFTLSKKDAFQQNKAHYGVWAERFSVLKISNPDGSFLLRHQIENLVTARSEISSIFCQFVSAPGLVIAPTLEDAAEEMGIGWVTEPDPTPRSFEAVLTNLGTLRGRFLFDPPLKCNAPHSFGWTTQVWNGDALTAWEYGNLYSRSPKLDVNGKQLSGKPAEYFAQPVWFPVERLQIGLRLPPSQTARPQLRYFELKQKNQQATPEGEVFYQGELRTYPEEGSAWQRNTDTERLEKDALHVGGDTELSVDYPTMGSQYSLHWGLPDPPLTPDVERLRGETEVVRNGLLVRKATRAAGNTDPFTDPIRALFEKVHKTARTFLAAKEPSFTTALMIWDRAEHRMVTIEVCRNHGRVSEASWNFWLPFGLGLAGSCFRTATAFRYQRDLDRGDPERPENYLPVPGSEPHAFLLSLPIDHPDMTPEIAAQPNAQRCRQLIGVLSIGSSLPASRLLELCRVSLDDEGFEKVRGLRDSCQKAVDEIAELLLESAGVGRPASAAQAPQPGLIHQPGPAWTSPVSGNRYRYKIAAFDFDGTLLRGEQFSFSWESIWQGLGIGKSVQNELKRVYRQQAEKADSQAARAEAYRSWCEQAVARFQAKGLTREMLRSFSQPLRLTAHCREALQQIRAAGMVTALVSGGVSQFLEDTFPDYREYFDFVFMNELTFADSGTVSGVRATSYDFEGKADALALVCARAGATRQQTVFIGDHFNDESAMVFAASAIAYPAGDSAVGGVSHVSIAEDDLLSLVPYLLIE